MSNRDWELGELANQTVSERKEKEKKEENKQVKGQFGRKRKKRMKNEHPFCLFEINLNTKF